MGGHSCSLQSSAGCSVLEAPGSAWLCHPALPCAPPAVALPRVPADGAISPCHGSVCGGTVSQMGISAYLAKMDFFPPAKSVLPHLVNRSGVGKAVPVWRGCDVQTGMSSWRGVGG